MVGHRPALVGSGLALETQVVITKNPRNEILKHLFNFMIT